MIKKVPQPQHIRRRDVTYHARAGWRRRWMSAGTAPPARGGLTPDLRSDRSDPGCFSLDCGPFSTIQTLFMNFKFLTEGHHRVSLEASGTQTKLRSRLPFKSLSPAAQLPRLQSPPSVLRTVNLGPSPARLLPSCAHVHEQGRDSSSKVLPASKDILIGLFRHTCVTEWPVDHSDYPINPSLRTSRFMISGQISNRVPR